MDSQPAHAAGPSQRNREEMMQAPDVTEAALPSTASVAAVLEHRAVTTVHHVCLDEMGGAFPVDVVLPQDHDQDQEQGHQDPDPVVKKQPKLLRRMSVSFPDDAKAKRYTETIEQFHIRKLSAVTNRPSTTFASSRSLRSRRSFMDTLHHGKMHVNSVAFKDATSEQPIADMATSRRAASKHAQSLVDTARGGTHATISHTASDICSPLPSLSDSDKPHFYHGPRTPRNRFSLHVLLLHLCRHSLPAFNTLLTSLFLPISPYSRLSNARHVIVVCAIALHVVLFPFYAAFLKSEANQHQQPKSLHIVATSELVLLLDMFVTFHTAFVDKHGKLVLSHQAIAQRYLTRWFVFDLSSSLPTAVFLLLHCHNGMANISVVGAQIMIIGDPLLRSIRIVHLTTSIRYLTLGSSNHSIAAWLQYSRFSHLLRIVWIFMLYGVMVHHVACGWKLLHNDHAVMEPAINVVPSDSRVDDYLHHFYIALQLMQGQSADVNTARERAFASLSVMLGSVTLAVIFGHIAMLLAHFSANATNYQRKMEATFAVMHKLQLPPALRERIHQYYEHLWVEYESLDGELDSFATPLSPALQAEVVLYKYVDLLRSVPYWRHTSADFQKQVLLHLRVRVFLPDDYIVRCGEVGAECFVLNRGFAELTRASNSFESATRAVNLDGQNDCEASVRMRRLFVSHRELNRGSGCETHGKHENMNVASDENEANTSVKMEILERGQAFGELALLMNYRRTISVRALSYVEVCVLDRADFQRMLVQHPRDRYPVLASILGRVLEITEARRTENPLMQVVKSVFECEETDATGLKPSTLPSPSKSSTMSATTAALLITKAINVPTDDDSITFGISSRLREQLLHLRDGSIHSSARTSSSPKHASMPIQNAVTPTKRPSYAGTTMPTGLQGTENIHVMLQEMQQQQRKDSERIAELTTSMQTMQQQMSMLQLQNSQLLDMLTTLLPSVDLKKSSKTELAIHTSTFPITSAKQQLPQTPQISVPIVEASASSRKAEPSAPVFAASSKSPPLRLTPSFETQSQLRRNSDTSTRCFTGATTAAPPPTQLISHLTPIAHRHHHHARNSAIILSTQHQTTTTTTISPPVTRLASKHSSPVANPRFAFKRLSPSASSAPYADQLFQTRVACNALSQTRSRVGVVTPMQSVEALQATTQAVSDFSTELDALLDVFSFTRRNSR